MGTGQMGNQKYRKCPKSRGRKRLWYFRCAESCASGLAPILGSWLQSANGMAQHPPPGSASLGALSFPGPQLAVPRAPTNLYWEESADARNGGGYGVNICAHVLTVGSLAFEAAGRGQVIA